MIDSYQSQPLEIVVVVVVVVVERGGLIRSSDNLSTRFSRRTIAAMEDYHDEAIKTPIYQTYTRVLHW